MLLFIQHAVVWPKPENTIDIKSKGLEEMLCYVKHKQEKSKFHDTPWQ